MKIHYHSAPPTADTGYGVHTRHLCRKLRNDHDIAVHSVGGFEGMGIDWEGIQIYPAGAGKYGVQSIPYWFDRTDSDIVFSHHDHWSMPALSEMQKSGIPMVLYTILDHGLPGGRPPEAVVNANENSLRTIVMSKWAEDLMQNSRVEQDKVSQIPHGVDTTKYAPVTHRIDKAELKRDLGVPEDCFLFGMVAANYGPRKNIPQHMEAFSRLRDEYGADDAYLYIHTHPTMGGGFNLYEVRDVLSELDRNTCMFPDPHEMYHGIEDMVVVQLYNTFDVSLNCTQSESWGLTVTEAMSTATPVIGTNYSAITEQFGVPYNEYVTEEEGFRVTDQGILVHRGNEMWTQNATARRFTPSVDDIYDAMVYYYDNRELIDKHGENGRDWVMSNYDWEYIYDKHWKPFFDDVEDEIDEEYNEWYFKKREAQTQSQAFGNEVQEIVLQCRGTEILDVGCGPGTLSATLQDEGYNVIGVDKSEYAVEMTEEKGIEAYQDDITDLDFKDNSFDTAIAQHVIEHVEPDAYAMKELARVTRKKVICITPIQTAVDTGYDPTEVRRYDQNEIERLAEEFKELTGYDIEYKKIHVGQDSKNWFITVDIEE